MVTLSASAQQEHPRDREIHDADTKAWWHTTETLSSDAMEGRDSGSAGYQRAAEYVAERFRGAGLKPAGEAGGYFQRVPMHEVAVTSQGTSFTYTREDGTYLAIPFLEQITINPAVNLPVETTAALTFRGYCGKEAMQAIRSKIVVCFGTQRQGLPGGAERAANARAGGALGIVTVDDPSFTIEPPRWPAAYARTVTADGVPAKAASVPLLSMRLSAALFARLLEGTKQNAAAILAAGGAKETLTSFDLPGKLQVRLHLTTATYSSPNIIAVLPGTDQVLKNEYVVIAAHLDGYGFGTPVAGDKLYNGALDDAAYVALLVQFADDLKARKVTPKRSILFCAFTGEEKGLLGAYWFVSHPTVPAAGLVADVNLDQLRPLFPLKQLTALAIDDTTLGQTAQEVGATLGIALKADAEPERSLLMRADHYPFLKLGVPAIGFIFGYEPRTEAERRYREWYQVRYHRPQDDTTQPIDFAAAAQFNQFFYKLVETVADAEQRPQMLAGSRFAKAKPLTQP